MNKSESIANIAKALASFQSEVKQPEKSGENPHFKSKYVTIDGTVKAIHDCAPKHGLSYLQIPISNEQGVGVITIIMHESGEFIEMPPFIMPLDKKTAQGVGSCMTYCRRYSLSTAFGIVSDVDDDGNEATQSAPQKTNSLPISPKEIGELKVKVLEFANLCDKTEGEVYEAIKVPDATKLTSGDAKIVISKLNGWISAKKETAKKESKGA